MLADVLAGSSILEPLLFLTYITDIPDDLESSVKLFADDTPLVSIVYDPNISDDSLDKDLKKNQNGLQMENDLVFTCGPF